MLFICLNIDPYEELDPWEIRWQIPDEIVDFGNKYIHSTSSLDHDSEPDDPSSEENLSKNTDQITEDKDESESKIWTICW